MFYGTYTLMIDRFSAGSRFDKRTIDRPASADTAARRRARRTLLRMNDRLLADMGVSRERLEQGVKAWPWRVEADSAGESTMTTSAVAPDAYRSRSTAARQQMELPA